jgi:peptide/nickel transport system permease protein
MSWRYVTRRLLSTVPALAAIVVITFMVIQFVPGDPAYTLAGPDAGEAELARVRQEYGLDRSLVSQLTSYTKRLVQGDLGESYSRGSPVIDVIGQHLGPTFLLTGTALLVSTVGGILLGVAAMRRAHGWFDHTVSTFTLVFYAVPSFWLAQLAIIWLVLRIPLFPLSGYSEFGAQAPTGLLHLADVGRHLVLPALVLASSELAAVTRLVRAGLLSESGQAYVRTAEAKGLDARTVLTAHALRNAMLPVVTLIGTRIGFLFSGAVVIETIFSWPGIGTVLRLAADNGDHPLMLGLVVLVSVGIIVANLVTDFVYAWIDPRIRYD